MSPASAYSKNPRPAGFTLIELLVVLFIIGILIALVVAGINKTKRAVYGAETQAQLSAISNAIQQYYNDYKSYPGPLANTQLCAGYDPTPAGSEPQIQVSATVPLGVLQADPTVTVPAPYNPMGITFQLTSITGAQNLVLGLLGGLEVHQTASGASTYGFYYNAQDIFAADGVTPAPRGPASLNIANPRRQQAYIQVKAGEISTPKSTYTDSHNNPRGASFADSANRSPGDQINTGGGNIPTTDAMIPVFLDKYPEPLPILYYRTNVAATAIVGFRNCTNVAETSQLQDPVSGTYVTAQYDLLQNLPYVCSAIGTQNGNLTGTLHNPNSFHGLRGITGSSNSNQLLVSSSSSPMPPVDSIDYSVSGANVPTNAGANGLAYFKDPSLSSSTYDSTPTAASNVHLGTARQKDGYILITAGPDRLYGTHDDAVFPGPLQP